MCWGDDFIRENGKWELKVGSKTQKDPYKIRKNSYRVQFSRGREGMFIFVPDEAKMNETYEFLKSVQGKIRKMKQVTVSGAVILRTNPETNQKEIFVTQRGYGDYKDGWEIPGGKLEPGETPEECIVREIREELATEVRAERILGVVDYDYPTFHLTMHCILCTIVSGKLQLLEHEAAKWVNKETLRSVEWLPADRLILDKIEELL